MDYVEKCNRIRHQEPAFRKTPEFTLFDLGTPAADCKHRILYTSIVYGASKDKGWAPISEARIRFECDLIRLRFGA